MLAMDQAIRQPFLTRPAAHSLFHLPDIPVAGFVQAPTPR
jgi:hypothetical protein